jgi:uncharacterized membrane protein YtjA (UPF0391 family)
MLRWGIGLIIIAVILAVLGFSGVAAPIKDLGWLFVIIAVILIVLTVVFGRGSSPPAI